MAETRNERVPFGISGAVGEAALATVEQTRWSKSETEPAMARTVNARTAPCPAPTPGDPPHDRR